MPVPVSPVSVSPVQVGPVSVAPVGSGSEATFRISSGALSTIADGDTAGTAVCQLSVANETGAVTYSQVSETVAGLQTSTAGAVTLDATAAWGTNPSATYKATDSIGDTVNTLTVTVTVLLFEVKSLLLSRYVSSISSANLETVIEIVEALYKTR